MWQFPCFSLIIRYLFLGFTCTKEGGKAEDRDVGEGVARIERIRGGKPVERERRNHRL